MNTTKPTQPERDEIGFPMDLHEGYTQEQVDEMNRLQEAEAVIKLVLCPICDWFHPSDERCPNGCDA